MTVTVRRNDVGESLDQAKGIFELLQSDSAGFCALAEQLRLFTGIHLADNPKNRTLMASRLSAILRQNNLQTYGELLNAIKSANRELTTEFVHALTTNTTQFFREGEHFEVLKRHAPELVSNGKRRGDDAFRIWCAAASTGQEPYTILMALAETLQPVDLFATKFLASDIDTDVLKQAADGCYSQNDIKDVPQHLLPRFFNKATNLSGMAQYRVKSEYSNLIRFAKVNLIEWPYPFQHQFDIIFCRNVLIYFDEETHRRVIAEIGRFVKPGGLLFLGHCDAGGAHLQSWKLVAPAVWRKETSR